VPRQQELVQQRRVDKARLEEEARQLRQEADSACMRGTMQREMGRGGRNLLEEAERKIREAMVKERDASDLEKLAHDGERNIHRLCDQLLVNGRQRGDVQRDREREEARVAEMAQNLERYKREVANCLTAARSLRAEEERLDHEAAEKEEQARRLEQEATSLDQEAARLEREAGPVSGW